LSDHDSKKQVANSASHEIQAVRSCNDIRTRQFLAEEAPIRKPTVPGRTAKGSLPFGLDRRLGIPKAQELGTHKLLKVTFQAVLLPAQSCSRQPF